MHLHVLAGDEFESEVIHANHPVAVFVRSRESAPCRMMERAVEDLAQHRNDIPVRVIDADASPALADRLAIHALPTLLVFGDGRQLARLVGFKSDEEIRAAVDASLARRPTANVCIAEAMNE